MKDDQGREWFIADAEVGGKPGMSLEEFLRSNQHDDKNPAVGQLKRLKSHSTLEQVNAMPVSCGMIYVQRLEVLPDGWVVAPLAIFRRPDGVETKDVGRIQSKGPDSNSAERDRVSTEQESASGDGVKEEKRPG